MQITEFLIQDLIEHNYSERKHIRYIHHQLIMRDLQ